MNNVNVQSVNSHKVLSCVGVGDGVSEGVNNRVDCAAVGVVESTKGLDCCIALTNEVADGGSKEMNIQL